MRRILLSVFLLTVVCQAQTATIKHTYYTTTFDTVKHIPIVVKWWLVPDMVSCNTKLPRGKFTPDPDLKKYTNLKKDYATAGKKYDTGHNMPAENNACSKTGMRECFYYSNMCPQTRRLNRGVWKGLEKHCQDVAASDSLLIWCGSVAGTETIGSDKVAVPKYCWKIVYDKSNGKESGYVFPNNEDLKGKYTDFAVTVDSVGHLSGIILDK